MNILPRAIALDGPIGSGKSTLGRLAADQLGWAFVEGDAHSTPGMAWYAESLTTARGILAAEQEALTSHPGVLIARPLRRIEYIYFSSHFAKAGIHFQAVGLRVSIEALNAPDRGRVLSTSEVLRSAEMQRQGYGQRPFNAFSMKTDETSVAVSTQELVDWIRGAALHHYD